MPPPQQRQSRPFRRVRNIFIALGICLGVFAMIEWRSMSELQFGRVPPSASTFMSSGEKLAPIIVGVGLGSSGTRTMQTALCRVGIPSAHNRNYCLRKRYFRRMRSFSQQEKVAVAAHTAVMLTYYNLFNQTNQEAVQSIDRLKEHVKTVVKNGSFIGLFDDPYTKMLPYLIRTIKEELGGRPILVFTDRDPVGFVKSRLSHHGVPVFLGNTTHALDFEHWQEAARESDPDDFFSSHFAGSKDYPVNYPNRTKLEKYFEKVVQNHRERVFREWKPDFYINFWAETRKMSTNEVGRKVWKEIKHLLPTEIQEGTGGKPWLYPLGKDSLPGSRWVVPMIYDEFRGKKKFMELYPPPYN